MKSLRTAIVGCGNVATRYVENIASYPNVENLGFADVAPERAEDFAAKHGGKAYADLAAVLADPDVDCVVNLTIHHAHFEVVTACLQAGKHVHSEKPLAMTSREANALVALAAEKNLRLSSAPTTFLGEAQQTAAKALRDGGTGPIRLVYAEINHGRIETWHPNPAPFYDVGVMFDVGVYPLAVATALFGPAVKVTAYGKVLFPDRKTQTGEPFTVTTPEFILAAVEFASGPVMRLTTNFYNAGGKQGSSMEFVGDLGNVYLESSYMFNAKVERAEFGKHYEPVELVRAPFDGIEFGRGVQDLAEAIAEGRPHRAAGEQAAHIVELIEAIHTGIKTGQPVEISSTFVPPPPMPWA